MTRYKRIQEAGEKGQNDDDWPRYICCGVKRGCRKEGTVCKLDSWRMVVVVVGCRTDGPSAIALITSNPVRGCNATVSVCAVAAKCEAEREKQKETKKQREKSPTDYE